MVHVAKLQKFGLWILLGVFLQPMIFATHLFAYTVAAWTPPKKKDSPIWPRIIKAKVSQNLKASLEKQHERCLISTIDETQESSSWQESLECISESSIIETVGTWKAWKATGEPCLKKLGVAGWRETLLQPVEESSIPPVALWQSTKLGSSQFLAIFPKSQFQVFGQRNHQRGQQIPHLGKTCDLFFPCSNSDPQLQPVSFVTLPIESNYLRSYPAPFRACFKTSSFGARKEDWERLNKIYHYIIGNYSKKTRETFQSIKSFVKCRGAFPLGRPGAPGIQIAGTLLESPLPGIAGSTFLQFSTKGAKDMEARLHRNRRQIDENKRVGKDGNTCKKNVHEWCKFMKIPFHIQLNTALFFLRFCRSVSWCRPPCLQIESRQFPACTLTTPHCF